MSARPWTRKDYLDHFERFLRGPGAEMSRTRFGYFAVGEPSFIRNLEIGTRQMRLSTIERAVEFVDAYVKSESRKKKSNEQSGAGP
jgi:hypothetical protein